MAGPDEEDTGDRMWAGGTSANQIRVDRGLPPAREAGNIQRQLNLLDAAIEETYKVIDVLENELLPALGPGRPVDPEGYAEDSKEQSALGLRIENATDKIRSIRARVNDLINRVET